METKSFLLAWSYLAPSKNCLRFFFFFAFHVFFWNSSLVYCGRGNYSWTWPCCSLSMDLLAIVYVDFYCVLCGLVLSLIVVHCRWQIEPLLPSGMLSTRVIGTFPRIVVFVVFYLPAIRHSTVKMPFAKTQFSAPPRHSLSGLLSFPFISPTPPPLLIS